MMTVGSRPAVSKMEAVRDVVVVLPWVPAMATPWRRRISSASISARGMMAMLRRRASTTSGLSSAMAVDLTSTCTLPTFSAAWPTAMRAPRLRRCLTTAESLMSEPEMS